MDGIQPRLLLTDVEAAALLNVPTATIRNLHRSKKLRGVTCGHHLRFRPQDVRAFVEGLQPADGGAQ